MKISLNWIFDHIKGQLAAVDLEKLVDSFIKITAEVESWKRVTLNIDQLTLVEVVEHTTETVIVQSPEHDKKYILPFRSDIVGGAWYLITLHNSNTRWTTAIDLGGAKEMLLPAIDISEALRAGGWKSSVEIEDCIVDIDNKSINNRPDLWGHRGLAREVAAILGMHLKSLDEFITATTVVDGQACVNAGVNTPYSISIESPDLCSRLATLYIDSVKSKPSQLSMVVRLSRLDSRSIDLLVDITNYVMLDLGQPMHAFDAHKLQNQNFAVRCAQPAEKLLLLDGQTIELTAQDLVITDGVIPISLAGVMGGAATSIAAKTQSVLLESANFDATTIRRTAFRHKKRTEASMRFEKNLDPYQNVDAIKRFLFLLNQSTHYDLTRPIISLGESLQQKRIVVEHIFIQDRLGIAIKPEQVVFILEKLAFIVARSVENGIEQYNIVVPTFRATKDISIPEDIVEEIGRYVGYDTLPRVMPSMQLQPHNLHKTHSIRRIKQLLSYGFCMRELYGYSFFDESVVRELRWDPIGTVAIKNPISENYTHLVTTLQPHMLKAVSENSIEYSELRFFEWARVWHLSGENIDERTALSGIFFDRCRVFDFYEGKNFVDRIFALLGINILWKSCETTEFPWYSLHQTAILMHEGNRIGIAGMLNEDTITTLSAAGGSAFIFELDGDYLLDYRKIVQRFNPLSKYPSVRRDISILVSLSDTTDTLTALVKSIDLVESVTLIDFFTKSDWKDKKAMTFHLEIGNKEKTLTASEIEKVWEKVIDALQKNGATIR